MASVGVEIQSKNQEDQNGEAQIREERESLFRNGEGINTDEVIRYSDNEGLEKRIRSLDVQSQVVLKNKHDKQNIYFIILGALITAVSQILSSSSPKCDLVQICFIPLFILAFFLIGIPLIHTAGKHAQVKIEYERCALERERRRPQENGYGVSQPDWFREKLHRGRMVITTSMLVIFNIVVTVFIIKSCGNDDKHATADSGCARICNKFCGGDI